MSATVLAAVMLDVWALRPVSRFSALSAAQDPGQLAWLLKRKGRVDILITIIGCCIIFADCRGLRCRGSSRGQRNQPMRAQGVE